MATSYFGDDKYETLKAWCDANVHTDLTHVGDMEFVFWTEERSLPYVPWGEERYAAITAAATALTVTLNATDPWEREHEFWIEYTP